MSAYGPKQTSASAPHMSAFGGIADIAYCRISRARKRNAAKWTHVRYKGSINFEPGPSEAIEIAIQSPDRGDEARLLSSFLVGSIGISASDCRLSRSST